MLFGRLNSVNVGSLALSDSGDLVVYSIMKEKMKKKTGPNWIDKVKLWFRKATGGNVFLCDTCKWDWRGACHRRERPNATWCPDYEKRGK